MMSFLCLAFPTTIFCLFGKTHPERVLWFSLFLSMQHPFGIFSFERRAIGGSYGSWGVCLPCAWSWSTHGQFSPWKQYETIWNYNYFNYNYVGCILNLDRQPVKFLIRHSRGALIQPIYFRMLRLEEWRLLIMFGKAACATWWWRDALVDVIALVVVGMSLLPAPFLFWKGESMRPQKHSKMITETPGV